MQPTRYGNGNTPANQKLYNQQYRAKEREQKRWLTEVAARLGLEREQLAKQSPDSIADAIRYALEK